MSRQTKPNIEESVNLLRLFIHTDTIAFGETDEECTAELACILRAIATRLESWDGTQVYQTIFDANGNDVGRYRLKLDRKGD